MRHKSLDDVKRVIAKCKQDAVIDTFIEDYLRGVALAPVYEAEREYAELKEQPDLEPLEEVVDDDLIATVFSAWWTDEVDQDGDGCRRSGRLNWDPDVLDCSGSLSVFEKISWKEASSGTWTLLHTTSVHTITDCSGADSQYVDFGFNSDCGPFDWKLEIYRDGESSPDYARDPSNDSDLNDHQEERAADDVHSV